MSQFSPPPPPSPSSIARAFTGSPRDGDERLERDASGQTHLEYFRDGSWRHEREKCRERVNPVCDREQA